jgi:hypothetical protein
MRIPGRSVFAIGKAYKKDDCESMKKQPQNMEGVPDNY